jgi:DNA gyrase subunit A
LDDVIHTIRDSSDADVARDRLMSRFNLSDRQAQAILDLQLRRLAALERQKIEDEQRQTRERIVYLEDLLAHPAKILTVIKDDTTSLAEKYGDDRRTHIAVEASEDLREEDLVPDEDTLVSITARGYVKRMAAKTIRLQARGGRGVLGHTTKEEDEVVMLFPARTLQTILFFSDKGKVYSEKAYQIPDADRTGRGIPIVNVLAMDPRETITAAVAVPGFDKAEYLTMATRKGRIKRVALSEFAAVRPSGLIAISLEGDDRLGWVHLTHGNNQILLVTEQGQALRFSEMEVRPMGRSAAGVTGIHLRGDDRLAGMEVVEPGGDLLVITAKGYGKRTPLKEYPAKGRATGGNQTINKDALGKIGVIVAARVVQEADELTIMSTSGVVIRTRVKDIAPSGRATRGVMLISLSNGSTVATVARIAQSDLEKVGATEGPPG